MLKWARLGKHCNTGATNISSTHHAIKHHTIHTTHTRPYEYSILIVRTEYNDNSIGGLTTGVGMAEPHISPPEEQAVPGSIPDELDKVPFFSIVDPARFAVRLSTGGAQVHQAGGTLQYDH